MDYLDNESYLDAECAALDAEFKALDPEFKASDAGPDEKETVLEFSKEAVNKCKLPIGSTYNFDEFKTTKHAMQLASSPNSFNCLFTDFSYAKISIEFRRFIEFIREHPEPGKSQLSTLILPVTVHLYALMMQLEDTGVEGARTFLHLNRRALCHEEENIKVLNELISFNNFEELKQSPNFQHYIDLKIVIKMSTKAFQSLQNFIRSSKHTLGDSALLSVLSLNICFENCSLEEFSKENNKNKVGNSSGESKKKKNGVKDKELKLEDLYLENIEISKIVIYLKKIRFNFKISDINSGKVICIDDTSEYKESKKDSKNISVNPFPVKPTRNVPSRSTTARSKRNSGKRICVDDMFEYKEPKKEPRRTRVSFAPVKPTSLRKVPSRSSARSKKKSGKGICIDDTFEYKEPKKEPKSASVSPVPAKPIYLRNVSSRSTTARSKMNSGKGICIDDIFQFKEPKREPKSASVSPVPAKRILRNVASRCVKPTIKEEKPKIKKEVKPKIKKEVKPKTKRAVKSKTKKEVKLKANAIEPKPKIKMKDEQMSSFRSFYSVDFNCSVTEIAYVTGDSYIYSLPISTLKNEVKVEKFFKNTTVILRSLEHEERLLKETKDPENLNVFTVKYLPGEPFNLLAACETKVRLFNTKTCTFLAEYTTNSSFIYDIDIDPTHQYFATANHDLAGYIYTFGCSTRICLLAGHEDAVTAVKFHPNGVYIATGSEDCTVRLFEVETGNCVRMFVGHCFGVRAMDFSYDGQLIASADSSGLVNVWDIKDCTVISKRAMCEEEVYNIINSIYFHKSSFILTACNVKGEVIFWDARNPEHSHIVTNVKMPVKIKHHKDKGWCIVYISTYDKESTGPK